MAWINVIVDGCGDAVKDIYDVSLARDNDGNVILFETSDEADNWCWNNSEPGLTYSTIEVWG